MLLNFRINIKSWSLLFLIIPFVMGSCKKFVDVPAPVTSVNQDNVYSSDATAIAVLNGIYTTIQVFPSPITGLNSISVLAGLSSDELTLFSGVTNPNFNAYHKNALAVQSGGYESWPVLYKYIFYSNAAIEGLNSSDKLTPSVKQQLLGEAKFIRAFCYFYLVNLFGDVPLAIGTDWQKNSTLSRSSSTDIYQRIIADLKEAQGLLSNGYVALDCISSTSERVRPNKWAATALLARAYLYSGNFMNAEEEATIVISNSTMYSLSALNNVFQKNSNEAIWQVQPVFAGWNTEDARVFTIQASGPTDVNGSNGQPVYLSTNLLNSFEAGDQRKTNWINSVTVGSTIYYYPYKYKSATQNDPMTEYLMVLRLGEQYLIRAEARARQNNIAGAQADLNAIRSRATLGPTFANDEPSLLTAINQERRTELFTEWGHRWLDLKRTNTVNTVMNVITPQKANNAPWQSYQQLYPVPLSEIQKAPNLSQNPGYN